MHSSEKGIASGRATLLGIIVGELRAFPPDAVDVWRFPDHQALMIDARLHPADVIPHDEEDVGLLLLLRDRVRRCCHGSKRRQQTDQDISHRVLQWYLGGASNLLPTDQRSPHLTLLREG